MSCGESPNSHHNTAFKSTGSLYGIYGSLNCPCVGRVGQSVQRLTTGWTVLGSNTGGARFSARPDRPWGRSSLLYNGYRFFLGCKEGPRGDADPSTSSSVVVIKEQSYISTPPIRCTACTEPQCLQKGALYLYLTFQSVQRLATAWMVRESNPGGGKRFFAPVQTGPGVHPASCTTGTGSFPGVQSGRGVTLTPHPFQCRGHERVELYLYSLYGPYGLNRVSVPVQG